MIQGVWGRERNGTSETESYEWNYEFKSKKLPNFELRIPFRPSETRNTCGKYHENSDHYLKQKDNEANWLPILPTLPTTPSPPPPKIKHKNKKQVPKDT